MFQNMKTMEIDEKALTLNDWQALEATAKEIIKNSSRDFILWSNVLKEVEKQEELWKERQEAE